MDLDKRERTIYPESDYLTTALNDQNDRHQSTKVSECSHHCLSAGLTQSAYKTEEAVVMFSHSGTDSLGKPNNLIVFDSLNQAAVLMKGILWKCLRSVQIQSYNRFGRVNKSL